LNKPPNPRRGNKEKPPNPRRGKKLKIENGELKIKEHGQKDKIQ
jgi:hypothetical protein